MKKRANSEMIKAWADNEELVVFVKTSMGWISASRPVWNKGCEYMLCLSKHKKAVLSLLNGGEAQIDCSEGWCDCEIGDLASWRDNGWYMREDVESHIKSKKQTRYAYFDLESGVSQSFSSESELREHYPEHGWQLITFEVEV